ncbi:MAG: hypothetical protein IT170_14860 [Bryobacterales bacterium]|nr:hypothetical protein [Bryobacterales bacterium]
MYRRHFLKAGSLAAAAGSYTANAEDAAATSADLGPPPILKSFTSEDHRKRLQNIAICEQGIRDCLRKHLILNYIPGQVSYNLGEYPSRKPYNPDDYDEQELDRLRDGGIRLIQIMEDWNDLLNLFGGNKFTAVNPRGLRRFVDMVHKRGMKILLYESTGYMQQGDPELKDEWVRHQDKSVQAAHWRLIRCSPASAGWRAFLLPRTVRILDDYGVDGLFNDWGYRPLYSDPDPPTKDEVLAWKESAEHDAAEEDLVGLIYGEVKRRGGIYKMHADNNNQPKFTKQYWDYLWVGEGVWNIDKVREETKNHLPYVIPGFDFRHPDGKPKNQDEIFLHTIPYMQFPLLLAGRPFTGERATIPGVQYKSEEKDSLLREWRAMWKYYQSHPNGPFVYGPWDSFPIWDMKTLHAKWLKRYLPLVQDGTWAYLEVRSSNLFASQLPQGVVASVFANRDLHIVLANFSQAEVNIRTTHSYVSAWDPKLANTTWPVPARSLQVLRKA